MKRLPKILLICLILGAALLAAVIKTTSGGEGDNPGAAGADAKHQSDSALTPDIVDAVNDHLAVSKWAYSCLGSPRMELLSAPLTELLKPASSPLQLDSPIPDASGSDAQKVAVPMHYLQILTLSRSLLKHRAELDRDRATSYFYLQLATILSIGFGLLITLVVTVSASEFGKQPSKLAIALKLGSLVLPPIGATIASVVAFYDPSATFTHQTQTAIDYTRLHAQIRSGVLKIDCANGGQDKPSPDFAKDIDTWSNRFDEIDHAATLRGGKTVRR